MGYRYAFWKFLASLTDANERAEQLLRMIRLEPKRDTLAMLGSASPRKPMVETAARSRPVRSLLVA